MAKISDIEIPSLLLDDQASTPTTPAAGFSRVFSKADGLYIVDDAGNVTGPFAASVAAATPQSAAYERTAGNYTTTSITFTDVDATNMALVITTGARRVMVGLIGTADNGGPSASYVYFTVAIDGVDKGGTLGMVAVSSESGGRSGNASFVYLSDVLTAASHTFKLRWRASAGTATLRGNSAGWTARFWVAELA